MNPKIKQHISRYLYTAATASAYTVYVFRVLSSGLWAKYMRVQARWPRLFLPAEYVLAALRLLRAVHKSAYMNILLRANASPSKQKALTDYGWGGGFIATEAERQEYWRVQAESSTITAYLADSSILDINAADSVLEAGCSAGGNLLALKQRFPGIRADGCPGAPGLID